MTGNYKTLPVSRLRSRYGNTHLLHGRRGNVLPSTHGVQPLQFNECLLKLSAEVGFVPGLMAHGSARSAG
jgi:hypothetical protein